MKRKKRKGHGGNFGITPPIWHSLACSNPEFHLEHPFFFPSSVLLLLFRASFLTLWVASPKDRGTFSFFFLFSFFSRPWTFTRDQITASRRGKARRGSWRRISKTTDRSPRLPPATLGTPSSPTSRNRSSSSIPPSHGRNPIVLLPSAPRTPLPISQKTVNLFVLWLPSFSFSSFAEFGSSLLSSVAPHALHSALVFVCRGSGERDCWRRRHSCSG